MDSKSESLVPDEHQDEHQDGAFSDRNEPVVAAGEERSKHESLSPGGLRKLMPLKLTITKKFSSNTFRKRTKDDAQKKATVVVDEPEVAAETAQRETQEVQVLGEDV
jgi:hypothetical protein